MSFRGRCCFCIDEIELKEPSSSNTNACFCDLPLARYDDLQWQLVLDGREPGYHDI
jgi:hypothetical protein